MQNKCVFWLVHTYVERAAQTRKRRFFAEGVYSYGTRPEQKNAFDEVCARETRMYG